MIREHISVAKKLYPALFKYADDSDEWEVWEEGQTIECSTWMDNFDLYEFCDLIGVPRNAYARRD